MYLKHNTGVDRTKAERKNEWMNEWIRKEIEKLFRYDWYISLSTYMSEL